MSWQLKSVNALMALLFAFNLFSVVPTSASHEKTDGVSHTISTELADLAHAQDKYQHDHIEHCGMASCTIALSVFNPAVTLHYGEKMRFLISETELGSLHHAPPGRPPLT